MNNRSVFDIDCTAIIPECGFKCPNCIQEIESTLTGIQGVNKVYVERKGQEQKLVVEHDRVVVTVETLINVFKGLPSFYEGFFIPSLSKNKEDRDGETPRAV